MDSGITGGITMPAVNTAASPPAWPAAWSQRQLLPWKHCIFNAKIGPLHATIMHKKQKLYPLHAWRSGVKKKKNFLYIQTQTQPTTHTQTQTLTHT